MQSFQKILSVSVAGVALAGILGDAMPASAQTFSSGAPGVASVSLASGNVVIIRGDSGAQVAAATNAVLVPGDYIATGPGSDAEVQFDGISMLRLANNTQVRLINLNPEFARGAAARRAPSILRNCKVRTAIPKSIRPRYPFGRIKAATTALRY